MLSHTPEKIKWGREIQLFLCYQIVPVWFKNSQAGFSLLWHRKHCVTIWFVHVKAVCHIIPAEIVLYRFVQGSMTAILGHPSLIPTNINIFVWLQIWLGVDFSLIKVFRYILYL